MSRNPASAMLRPSLLDRLSDVPERSGQMSLNELKQMIVRDVGWLLNANGLDQTLDLEAYPHVADSVLNFGAPAMDGQHREGLDLYRLQEGIARCLRRFEPRLLPDTLHVTSMDGEDGKGGAINIRIEAEIRADPLPLRVVMRTEIDPETPVIRVVECRPESYA